MAYGYVQPNTYRDPNDKYSANPQGAYGQESDWFKANPYQGNPYAKVNANLNQQGNRYLNMNPTNPFGAGGPLGSVDAYRRRFGMDSYPDINDPRTVSTLGKYMDEQRSGLQTTLDAYAKAGAQRGIVGSRGGMGVTGGVTAEGQAQQDAMRTAAGQYGGNFANAMEWMRQKALYDQGTGNSMANLYGDIYKTNAATGADLLGKELQGTKYGADDLNAYMDKMFGAYSRDTANTNRLREGEADTLYKRKMQQQGLDDAQFGRDQRAGALGQLTANRPKTGFNEYMYTQQMAPIWQQQAGITPGSYAATGNTGIIKRGGASTDPYSRY